MMLPPHADLIGTPFVMHGRDPMKGLSCWGLVCEMYERWGFKLSYDRWTFPGYKWETIQVEDMQAMDLVFINKGRHVAIALEGGWLLHALPKVGTIRVRLSDVLSTVSRVQRLRKCLP